MMTPTVTGLYCYPIKSCKAIALERTNLSLRGILYDREWAVIDTRTGKVLDQRAEPRLCLVETAINGDTLEWSAPGGGGMRLAIEGDDGPVLRTLDVDVWGERAAAHDQGTWPAGWFSAFLGRDCTLVRMAPHHVRPSRGGTRIAFADAHEILVISEASLADLNARMEAPLPMDRFRPNVVVAGCPPYAEDDWTAFSIGGGVRLLRSSSCIRCAITTTDQATSLRGKEPLKTLATYRKMPKGVVFGRYYNGMNGGQITLGDPVEVL